MINSRIVGYMGGYPRAAFGEVAWSVLNQELSIARASICSRAKSLECFKNPVSFHAFSLLSLFVFEAFSYSGGVLATYSREQRDTGFPCPPHSSGAACGKGESDRGTTLFMGLKLQLRLDTTRGHVA
jgi:hypothetical protein